MPILTASFDLLGKLILLLTIASWIFWLVALLLTFRFFREAEETISPYTPGVSIIIPIKGIDPGMYENFASLCQQDYPNFELLIGVFDPNDPAIPLIETLQREYSGSNISIIVAQPEGTNQKAALLHHLANQARFPIIVAIDSDMRVTPSYLRQVVSPLSNKQVGMVTSCYRGTAPITFTARLEALHMGATFLPQVLVARKFLSMRFAMGSTIAVRRRDLEKIGGFASVADYLADDYQIGLRMSLSGHAVHLSRYVTNSVIGETTFREQWDREVRWSRTTRVSRPLEYPGQILTLSTPLALILLVVTNFDSFAYLALLVSVSLRWLVAWWISDWTGNKEMRRWMIWLPVRDGLSAVTLLAGSVGHEIVWRGRKFRVQRDGKLVPEPTSATRPLEVR